MSVDQTPLEKIPILRHNYEFVVFCELPYFLVVCFRQPKVADVGGAGEQVCDFFRESKGKVLIEEQFQFS